MNEETREIPKVKLVLFEGVDKTGKSTLFRAFRAATHYIPLAIDRFTGSNIVYDLYYGRESDLEAYILSELNTKEVFDVYLVVLTGDPEKIKIRIIQEEETEESCAIALENFVAMNELFQSYFSEITCYDKKLILNTTASTVDECLEQILEFTGEERK